MVETIVAMKIKYFHASKYGNGAMVAEEFRKQPVPVQLTRAYGQAHRRHEPFPEEGHVALGSDVRHPDH